MKDALVEGQHSKADQITEKCNQINTMWFEVRELAQARHEALIGAKQVHAFVRDADDAIDWIQEKEMIVSTDNYGSDRETVQILIDKHDGFEVRFLLPTGEKLHVYGWLLEGRDSFKLLRLDCA